MVTPACLPLTVEFFPTVLELESSYDVFSYDFVVHPPEMRSFLARAPALKGNAEEVRREWALVVMRGMAAVRLAQGFQFILQSKTTQADDTNLHSRSTSFMADGDMTPKPNGASEILRSTAHPVYLSMSNEIHRISYTGEAIQVRRYVRRMPPSSAFEYQCLIWPKLGGGYTELETSFASHGLENYGWNRYVLV
jgi:DEP domain-containing protein 5